MDHYIPKRRVPISLWSADIGAAEGQIFLDLDPSGSRHQTILAKLNSPSRFLPVATGPDGRIELVNRVRLLRLVPGPDVLQSDVFTRGFTPSREEDAGTGVLRPAARTGSAPGERGGGGADGGGGKRRRSAHFPRSPDRGDRRAAVAAVRRVSGATPMH